MPVVDADRVAIRELLPAGERVIVKLRERLASWVGLWVAPCVIEVAGVWLGVRPCVELLDSEALPEWLPGGDVSEPVGLTLVEALDEVLDVTVLLEVSEKACVPVIVGVVLELPLVVGLGESLRDDDSDWLLEPDAAWLPVEVGVSVAEIEQLELPLVVNDAELS